MRAKPDKQVLKNFKTVARPYFAVVGSTPARHSP
jgi:hypothetical protein